MTVVRKNETALPAKEQRFYPTCHQHLAYLPAPLLSIWLSAGNAPRFAQMIDASESLPRP